MWTNYGIPNKEAVRVRFYARVFLDWYDASKSGIRVYGVNPDGSLESLSSKPALKLVDVRIYQTLLDRYHLRAGECLFIDDSPANIEGAKKAGLATWHIPTSTVSP